jgi:hypothetical protein
MNPTLPVAPGDNPHIISQLRHLLLALGTAAIDTE